MVRLPSRGVETLRLGKGEAGEEYVRRLTKDGVYRDGAGLYLYVTNGGKGKSWLYRYTFKGTAESRGKPESMTLGSYHQGVTLDMARERANQAGEWLYDRKDPKKWREIERQRNEIEAGRPHLVGHFLAQYVEDVVSAMPLKGKKDAEAHCETIRTTIGLDPIDIKPREIVKKSGLFDMWDEKRSAARALKRHLFGVFNFAVIDGVIDKNPMAAEFMKIALPRTRHIAKPHASIPVEDIPAFLAHLRNQEFNDTKVTKALMIEWVVLTSVRSNEVRGAKWKEINSKDGTWEVPPERLKIGKRFGKMRAIPITKPMIAVLERAKERRLNPSDDEALIFPPPEGPDGKGRPLKATELSEFMEELKWQKQPDARVHGFRNTLKDWNEEDGKYDDILVERQQDRLPKDGTAAANRYTHLVRTEAKDRSLKRRRQMMDDYAKVCDPGAFQ